jgi:hypothetical protein
VQRLGGELLDDEIVLRFTEQPANDTHQSA